MSEDGDGTYSYTTESGKGNLINCMDSSPGFGKWFLQKNVLYINSSFGGSAGNGKILVRIMRISNSKLLLENHQHGASKVIFFDCGM